MNPSLGRPTLLAAAVRDKDLRPDPGGPRRPFPWRSVVRRGVASLSVLVGFLSLMGAVFSPWTLVVVAAILIGGEVVRALLYSRLGFGPGGFDPPEGPGA